jgi:hypothetical protein
MEKGELRVRCPNCRRGYHLRWRPGASPAAPEAAASAGPAAPAAPPSPATPRPVAPTLAPSAAQGGTPDPQQARRAKRFARALAEGILQGPGRRERRDRALAEGRLLQDFSAELRTAWRLYVDKVGEDVACNSSYFRDAFNEILADGRQLF